MVSIGYNVLERAGRPDSIYGCILGSPATDEVLLPLLLVHASLINIELIPQTKSMCRNEVQRIQWNASSLPKLLSASRQRALPQRVVFEEQLVARHMLCIWAARLLTDVAVLSREHDTCTLLQMPPDGVPGLADVLQTLLTAYALLDKHLEVCFCCTGPGFFP